MRGKKQDVGGIKVPGLLTGQTKSYREGKEPYAYSGLASHSRQSSRTRTEN